MTAAQPLSVHVQCAILVVCMFFSAAVGSTVKEGPHGSERRMQLRQIVHAKPQSEGRRAITVDDKRPDEGKERQARQSSTLCSATHFAPAGQLMGLQVMYCETTH